MAVVSNPLGGLFKVPDLGDTGFSETRRKAVYGTIRGTAEAAPHGPGSGPQFSHHPEGGRTKPAARRRPSPPHHVSPLGAEALQPPPRPLLQLRLKTCDPSPSSVSDTYSSGVQHA